MLLVNRCQLMKVYLKFLQASCNCFVIVYNNILLLSIWNERMILILQSKINLRFYRLHIRFISSINSHHVIFALYSFFFAYNCYYLAKALSHMVEHAFRLKGILCQPFLGFLNGFQLACYRCEDSDIF